MRLRRIEAAAVFLAFPTLTVPAVAQDAPKATTAQEAPKAPDTNQEFLVGLRRVGVMAGQAVECSGDAEKQAKIAEAMDLANQIAIHFGLKAAFNYVGAVGYGSGRPFDKAGCAQSIAGWKDVLAKYANK
jgi:hypothetical protein